MKKLFYPFLLGAIALCSCSESDGPGEGNETEVYDFTEILTDYVDNTVVPTYADMKDNAMLLNESVIAFMENGSQADIEEACADWKATRKAWECSEAFLFGPAAYKNLDPLLDSWPLDQAQLDQVLNGSQELTADYVRDGLGAVLRGFHTIEYLLFRDGAARTAADVSTREKEYLVAVTEVLCDDCLNLWASWAGVQEGTTEADILASLDIEIATPYANYIKNAGQTGSQYLSQTDAVQEIIEGMIAIADEVANGKIAEPVNSGNVLDVESWFSWNSLTDFTNNIHSVENCYLNGYDGSTPGASLSDAVAELDADLDMEVKAQIAACLAALQDIPEPFRNNLNNSEKTSAAMDAINELADLLQQEVLPLFVN